ncbi:hypothetical protein MTBBW1_2360047 [Desulfamplus magnetovallimortis]|uniref:PIN domain-containing protein n=1 Tax=Desulfamplus magnetovallimortis TaxID=1246637 RepID=A0A1W1HDU0_9BACT|nr:hypothetical protein [Desulfamplus magnetovallimortis]SLM30664.1 hypothetical protein MTBBW1_2360047 [Desulfamplus magnetovallimortis]
MKVFVDTNVIMDILLDREPFQDASCFVWDFISSLKVITPENFMKNESNDKL